MSLSKSSIEVMIDMIENRLSDMVVTDREDAKEQMLLRRALQELASASLSQDRSTRRRAVRRPAMERSSASSELIGVAA